MKTDFNKFNKQGFGSLNNSTNSIQKSSHPKAKQVNFAADNQPSLFDTFNVPKQDSFQKTAVAEPVPAAPVQSSAPAAAPVNYNYQPQQPQEQSSGFGLKDGLLSIGVLAGIGLGAYAVKNKEGVKNAIDNSGISKLINDSIAPAIAKLKADLTVNIEEKLKGAGTKTEIPKNTVSICESPKHNGPLRLEFTKFEDARLIPQHVMDSIRKSISPAGRAEALKALKEKPAIVNPRIANISYEGLAGDAGGQAVVATQLPNALIKGKADVFDIIPMLEGNLDGVELSLKKHDKPDTFIFTNKVFKKGLEVKKLLDKKVTMVIDGKEVEKTMEVYHGIQDVNGKNKDLLFVRDADQSFNIGSYNKRANIYNQGGVGCTFDEKPRMALFNRYTFELLDSLKKGEVKIKDDKQVEKPLKAADRMIAHETWQSGGLFAQMRTMPVIDAEYKPELKDRANYFKELADSSLTIIHNAGEDYQGRIWNANDNDRKTMQNIVGVWFGKDAAKIVEEGSFINFEHENLSDNGEKILNTNTPTGRAGFIGEKYNPATWSIAGGGTIINVSKGYQTDVTEKFIAGDIRPLIRAFTEIGAIKPIRNGIDKTKEALKADKVKSINEFLSKELYKGAEPVKDVGNVLPLHNDDGTLVSDVITAKKSIKTAFMTYLKEVMPALKDENKFKILSETHPENWGTERASLLKGTENLTDLSTINKDTPLYAISGRFDKQKGFDTIILAVKKMNKKADEKGLERPVIVIAGNTGDNEHYKNSLVSLKKKLGKEGERIVIFDGRMGDQMYPMVQGAADFGLMPSNFEPCGIGDAEMMAKCSPIIGAAVGGIKEKVGTAGIIMEHFFGSDNPTEEIMHHNANILADAMIEGLEVIKHKPDEHARMIKEAGEKDFSWYLEDATGKMKDDCPVAQYFEALHVKIDPTITAADDHAIQQAA